MRKLIKLRKDKDTDKEDKKKIVAFIKGVVSSDLRDGDWLGEAGELLGSVNATMGAEELQRFYGLDIQAYRGSSPNIQELLDNEEELELESLRNGDGDNSMNTSTDVEIRNFTRIRQKILR